MERGAKSARAKVEARPAVARKPRKAEVSSDLQFKKRLAEASEQHAAISEILGVISSSPGDVKPVLATVAERAAHLCDASFAQVLLVEGNVLRPTVAYWADAGTDEDYEDSRGVKRTWPVTRRIISGRAVLDCEAIHYADVVPLLDSEFPDSRAKQQELGFRAVLVVPLLREGRASGVIFIFRREPRPFSPEQVALVQTFACQAAIAIANVRLFKETKEALEQQTATSEILRVIASSPGDVKPMLDAVAERAVKLCDAADATIFLIEGDRLRSAARFGLSPTPLQVGEFMPLTRGSVTGRAVVDGAVIHIEDLAAAPEEEFPVARALQRRLGHRTALSVPLMREDRAIGGIALWRMDVRRFTDGQIELVKTFADQAAIAIENVRLFNETKEALERQTATSEILRVISQSRTDVQPVFDIIVAAALKLCRAGAANVFTFDGKLIRLAALSDPGDPIQNVFPRPPSRDTAITRAVLTGSVVAIPDVLEEPEYTIQDAAIAGGFRSVLAVPLMRDNKPIGAIAVGRPEPGPFPGTQIALLQTFADQAVIAIENVRLFTELEARTLQLTQSVGELKALGEVGQAVSSTLDLETVLSTIVSRATQLAGMDGGSIWEYDEARAQFHLHATDRLPGELVEVLRATPIRKGEGALGRLAITGEAVEIRDVADERSYPNRIREILIRCGYRSVLAVPLLREDHLLGALAVNRSSPGEFAPEVIDLLKTFATQSALAIQNARLFREIEIKSQQLEIASRHKSEFLANMSHELRTPLNAIIGFSEVLAERLFGEVNAKQAEYLNDILESGRHLLSLINDILDLSKIEAGRMELERTDFDLTAAIENALTLVRERAQRHGITLGRMVDERLGMIRADERKVKQVLLNLLSNALKFTPAGGTVNVRADVTDGEARILITDTGVGIAAEDQKAVFEEFRQVGTASRKMEGTGLGLTISRKFIELHGGRIWVESQVGLGSTFAFTLPLTIGQPH
jgi:signal transduction histidine kinase